MAFHIGDNPALISVPFSGLSVDGTITAVSASLQGQALGVSIDTEDEQITLTVPAGSLTEAGVYSLSLRLTVDGSEVTYPLDPVVVQDASTGWHTVESARAEWQDAPREDVILFTLLDAAREQCVLFAPALDADQLPPLRYCLAQLMQARALWQSTKANGQGEIGEGGFTVQVFPMDWTVKSLLRPRRGIPVIA